MEYYAHTATLADGSPNPDPSSWQPLYTGDPQHPGHLDGVARLAAEFASAFDAADWARLAGLWHDLGKYSEAFRRYLVSASDPDADGESPGRGPDHSTAGAQHAAKYFAPLGPLLGYLIAGHHSGLPNGRDSSATCLEARLAKAIESYSAAPAEVTRGLQPPPRPPGYAFTSGYALGFFLRFAFSALVDADRRDTESFMSPERAAQRDGRNLPTMRALRACLDAYLARFGTSTTAVQRARAEVLAACLARAGDAPGLFSLTVPTGGGKTLSSLAFALEHAIAHDFERVIYVLPFTSIIEQNAAVFREVFAAFGNDVVIEHHSNLDPDASHQSPTARLATEDWNAPVIVTTSVQFFESLHAAKPSRCRKLHRLTRSVIILDEAQTLPVTLLRPCLEALRQLSGRNDRGKSNYQSSIVLCTATQPAIEYRDDFKSGLRDVREIVPDRRSLFDALRRVRVTSLGSEPLADSELATKLAAHPQVLCIVNTRRHAAELFQRLPTDSANRHLSALMCPAHRSEILGDPREPAPGTIRHALLNGLPCRVVTTQLIEAGVDVDFPVVYRALAGLDSIAQAAGRCNREGRLVDEAGRSRLGDVFVFAPEQPIPAGFLRRTAESAAEILPRHIGDPLAPAAIEDYFRLHYWRHEDQIDAKRILECFPRDSPARWTPEHFFLLQFKDCAERFQFIESAYEPVIVPYGDRGRELVDALRAAFDPAQQRTLARRLQRYVVQIPEPVAHAFLGRGLVRLHDRFLVLEDDAAYSPTLGLQLVHDRLYDPEKLTA
ncbi:MAG: CRISPR-associated endonuclease Cas3'' [Opitutus sp.]|nr:CRISPR-associated endonuclease Cas3'' [Opitutus sp.]